MKANKTAILILTLLSMVSISCSSKEDKLVGEWQSNKPESIHLSLAQGERSVDGFYHGLTYTENGQTYGIGYWKTLELDGSTFLWYAWKLSPGDGQASGADHDVERRKIIELTSDKLVIEWIVDNQKQVVEFQRVK